MLLRQATESDLPRIVQLKRALFEEAGYAWLLAADFNARALAAYTRDYRQQEGVHFIAVEGPDLVAMAGAFVKADVNHPYYRDPRYGLLGDVYTVAEFRRMGLARQLSEAALDWLRPHGLTIVRLFATEMARELYENLGFQPTDEMALYLAARPTPV